ncbi:hypothetical protein ACWDKQ_28390 [Saccharopolyspora sp. NPDC000995]
MLVLVQMIYLLATRTFGWLALLCRATAAKRCEPKAVRRLVPDLPGDLAAKDGVLVPEHEQFGVLGGVTVQQHCGDGQ